MVEGERVGGDGLYQGQLCLSNPEVFAIALQQVRSWLRENPHCKVVSVAQNDNQNDCTCPRCQEIDCREGSPMGSVLLFVNKLAGEIGKEHPDVLIHTFAYQYTTPPPLHVRPADNVIVRLCAISCSYARDLASEAAADPQGKTAQFVRELEGWSGICRHLHVWDHCTDFSHDLLPSPTWRSLGENRRLYRRMGVRGVVLPGQLFPGGGAAMAELEAWLQAKLLWDLEQDPQALIDTFLAGYFGKGAPFIRQYMALMEQAVEGHTLTIYDGPDAPYFSDGLVEQSQALFVRALKVAESEPVRLRIQRAKLSVDYLELTRLPMDAPGREARIDAFGEQCRLFRISELHERTSLEQGLAFMKRSRCCKTGTVGFYCITACKLLDARPLQPGGFRRTPSPYGQGCAPRVRSDTD